MADDWESEHGLDPGDGDDHAALMPSGYTAIEEYINGLSDELVGQSPPGPTVSPPSPGPATGQTTDTTQAPDGDDAAATAARDEEGDSSSMATIALVLSCVALAISGFALWQVLQRPRPPPTE